MKFRAKIQVSHNQFKTVEVTGDTQKDAWNEASKAGQVIDIRPTEIIIDNGFSIGLYFLGEGYPYECPSSKKYPDSAVYYSYTTRGWVASHDLVQKPNGTYRVK